MELKLSIIDISILEVHFRFDPDFVPEPGKPIEIKNRLNINYEKQKDQKKKVNVFLIATSDSATQPFVYSVTAKGVFEFNKIPRKDELDKIAHINCASIIFPYIRETIADLTRRSGIPPFHLDPVNFVAAYHEKVTQDTKPAKKRKAAN